MLSCYNRLIMLRRTRAFRKFQALLLAGVAAAGSWASAWAMICDVDVPPVLSITDETGDFTLSFADFAAGSLSSTQDVTYRVQANNMAGGTVSPAVTAELGSAFDLATLEGDVSSYSNLGESEFSILEESDPGYVAIGTSATPLTTKKPGTGHGEHCLDGNLVVTWRAKLTADAPAGSESRSLIVTLKDGN